jgi:hypothetical protein
LAAAEASRNTAASNAQPATASRFLAVAYILAVSMPPIGFCVGIAIAARFSNQRSKHGVWIMLLSALVATVWIVVIVSGALKSPGSSDY